MGKVVNENTTGRITWNYYVTVLHGSITWKYYTEMIQENIT